MSRPRLMPPFSDPSRGLFQGPPQNYPDSSERPGRVRRIVSIRRCISPRNRNRPPRNRRSRTVIENGPRRVRTTVSRASSSPCLTTRQDEHFAVRLFLLKLVGQVECELVQVDRPVRLGQDEQVVGPDPLGRPIGEEQGDLARGQHGLPAFGKVESELELALNPAVRLAFVKQVGTGVRRREAPWRPRWRRTRARTLA